MESRKLKIYVLMISTRFLASHPKAGLQTYFAEKIELEPNKIKVVANGEDGVLITKRKIHTIRHNVDLWEKRIKEVQAGKAVISIRQWTGKPYQSKQQEIRKITKEDNPAVEFLRMDLNTEECYVSDRKGHPFTKEIDIEQLAINDGLNVYDFIDWFHSRKPIYAAIIHFTPFRYCK